MFDVYYSDIRRGGSKDFRNHRTLKYLAEAWR